MAMSKAYNSFVLLAFLLSPLVLAHGLLQEISSNNHMMKADPPDWIITNRELDSDIQYPPPKSKAALEDFPRLEAIGSQFPTPPYVKLEAIESRIPLPPDEEVTPKAIESRFPLPPDEEVTLKAIESRFPLPPDEEVTLKAIENRSLLPPDEDVTLAIESQFPPPDAALEHFPRPEAIGPKNYGDGSVKRHHNTEIPSEIDWRALYAFRAKTYGMDNSRKTYDGGVTRMEDVGDKNKN